MILLGAAGGIVAAVGAASPWLSFFGGLVPVPGTAGLSGQVAVGLGLAAALSAVAYGATGSSAARWALAVVGAALLAVAGIAAINLVVSLPALQADPLSAARPEPGIIAVVAGATLVFSTFFVRSPGVVDRPRSSPRRIRTLARPALVVALGFAGLVHLAHGPEHLASSTVLGGATIVAGVAQLLLAAAVGRSAFPRFVSVAVPLLGIGLVAAWALAVTIGLPVEPHAHPAAVPGHGPAGHAEPVSAVGFVTARAELATIALARLIRVRGDRP